MATAQPVFPGQTETGIRILEALADVVLTDGVSAFSVQAVADQAGVSHRTVYRYFPSREALLEGLTEHLDRWMRAEGLPGTPTSFDETIQAIPVVYEFFETHAPLVEAMVIVSLALRIEPRQRQERTEGFISMMRREAPHLQPAEAHRWALALRSLASSQQWYALTRRFGLDPADAVTVTVDSLRTLIGEIRRRDARMQRKEGSR